EVTSFCCRKQCASIARIEDDVMDDVSQEVRSIDPPRFSRTISMKKPRPFASGEEDDNATILIGFLHDYLRSNNCISAIKSKGEGPNRKRRRKSVGGAVYARPKSSNANLGRFMTAPTDYFSEREAGDDRPLAGSRRRWRVCGIDKAKARSDSAVDRARSV